MEEHAVNQLVSLSQPPVCLSQIRTNVYANVLIIFGIMHGGLQDCAVLMPNLGYPTAQGERS